MALGHLRRILLGWKKTSDVKTKAAVGHKAVPGEKVAIITGGASGIGRASAQRLAREGYRVLIGGLASEKGDAVCAAIREAGGEARFVAGDVARQTDCAQWAAVALREWGRIDVLVASAGARVYGSIQTASDADWEKIVGVNFRGVSDSCAAVLPAMIAQKSGSIVIISSTHAIAGRADMPLYDATKAAVLSLARSLAVAHGKDGIRVNAVCPGYTLTEFHEMNAAARGVTPEQLRTDASGYGLLGRAAEPDEIAAAVYFLASDDASNITGQSLMVDGGVSIASK